MNISDYEDSDVKQVETDLEAIIEIFDHQGKLHVKYASIEEKNGIGYAIVSGTQFGIDDSKWQYLIKDYAWRVTEELTEALEAYNENSQVHELEEIIDSLHFYTELMIICKVHIGEIAIPGVVKKEEVITYSGDVIPAYMDVIYRLGLACNMLKNKPWKNSHLITDSIRFYQHLVAGYRALLCLAMSRGLLDMKRVHLTYMKKNMVNNFRIESNY